MRARIVAFVAAAALIAGGPALLPRSSAAALSCTFPEVCYTLTVSVGGNGSGSWDSADGSFVADGFIHCDMHDGSVVAGSVCAFTYRTEFGKSILVNYLLTPSVGSLGCHMGFCYSVTVHLTHELSQSETLNVDTLERQPYRVTVTKSGVATGTVTSSPAGIDCGSTCQAPYLYDTALTLTAVPDAGAAFQGLTQDCARQGAVCTIHVGTSTQANAVFGLATPPPSATVAQRPHRSQQRCRLRRPDQLRRRNPPPRRQYR